MHIPTCPLCNSSDNKETFSERGYMVYICGECGLFYIHPYPRQNDVVHEKVHDYTFDEIEILDAEKHYLAEIEFYKKYFPMVADECKDAATVLDVGCGTGHLLERLNIFPDIVKAGIELNTSRAEMARKVSGCEIHQVPIEEFTSATKYDVILLMQVLSHIPSFDNLFGAIKSLISENGKLILKVGELEKDVKKGDMFDWEIPDHLHFLGINTIEFICRKYGFTVLLHDRIPLSEQLFSRETWKSPGRSVLRNAIKRIIVTIPFALTVHKGLYNATHGKRIYSSFIVLTPKTE